MLTQVPVAKQKQIAKRVAEIERKLKPDVVRIRYDIGEDWSGDPAIFFRILLSDKAAREDRLTLTTRKVRAALGELKLIELGLFPLHSFRSEAEQDELQEESWAK